MRYRKVPGFLIEITKNGKHIRNSVTKKIKTPYIDKDGYKLLNIKTDDYEKTLRGVHVLVALAWVGPKPSKKHQVNHKDLDKSNNYYKNLEWCTGKENIHHARDNGNNYIGKNNPMYGRDRGGENGGQVKLTWKKVKIIKRLKKKGYTYRKISKKLSKKFKVSKFTIIDVLNNRTWKDK
jgi:hypothetical protein